MSGTAMTFERTEPMPVTYALSHDGREIKCQKCNSNSWQQTEALMFLCFWCGGTVVRLSMGEGGFGPEIEIEDGAA